MLPAITSTAIDYNLEDRFWIWFKFSVPWWLSKPFYKTDYFSGRNMNVLIISSGIFLDLSLLQVQFSSIATLSFKPWKVFSQSINSDPILPLMTVLARDHDHSTLSCTSFETSPIWVYSMATTLSVYQQLFSFPMLLMTVKGRPTTSFPKLRSYSMLPAGTFEFSQMASSPILNGFPFRTSEIQILWLCHVWLR